MKDDFIYFENCSIDLSVDTVHRLHEMLLLLNSICILTDENKRYLRDIQCFKDMAISEKYQFGFLKYLENFSACEFQMDSSKLLYCLISFAYNQLELYHEELLENLSN